MRHPRPAPSRSQRTGTVIRGVVGVCVFLALWEAGSRTGVIDPRSIPAPSTIAVAFAQIVGTSGFWLALWLTVSVTASAIVIVSVLATALAMLLHRSRFAEESSWFLVEFLKPIPPAALIPLGLLLWGQTQTQKIILIVFAAIWPLLTQLVYGMREVSGTALEVSRVYRLSGWQRQLHIVIPSVTPFALTGLRISVSIALIVSIMAEYIGGVPGLGQLLALAQLNGMVPDAFAIILACGLLGLLLNGILSAASTRILFWHSSQREKTA